MTKHKQTPIVEPPSNSQEWTVHDFIRSDDTSTNDLKTIKSQENNDTSAKPCLAATPSYFESMQCYDNVSRCPMRPSLAIPITCEKAKYFGLPYAIAEHHSLPFDLSRRAAVVQVQLGNCRGETMIDTGCLRTIISPRLVSEIGGQLEGNYRETATCKVRLIYAKRSKIKCEHTRDLRPIHGSEVEALCQRTIYWRCSYARDQSLF